ncbi:hypothetical protein DL897_05545 [Thermoflavimicrobium daqui]|uniref:Uncharacterized protein n=2 Tax=Thermoflavimicrobium daqui TaxID=2137476 RepID=A0A364K827_9BACL|nr:hypothetical protein DL897_05545 [Thermoflavimicrobium daqui]
MRPHVYKSRTDRPNWCYGEIGIARALYLSSKVINDYETFY